MSASTAKRSKGIGGSGTVLVDARIKISFIGLGMVIDVTFSILEE